MATRTQPTDPSTVSELFGRFELLGLDLGVTFHRRDQIRQLIGRQPAGGVIGDGAASGDEADRSAGAELRAFDRDRRGRQPDAGHRRQPTSKTSRGAGQPTAPIANPPRRHGRARAN